MMTMQQAQAGLEWNNCAAESAADETLKINFLTTFERKLAHCQFWKGRFFEHIRHIIKEYTG